MTYGVISSPFIHTQITVEANATRIVELQRAAKILTLWGGHMIDIFSVIGLTIIMKPLTRCGIPSALDDANHSEYISMCEWATGLKQ